MGIDAMTSTSKKLLVAFNPSEPDEKSSDFLVPVLDEKSPHLLGLKSNMPVALGLMVYLGREITVNDLFAKLVDTGRKLPDVDSTLKYLEAYLKKLQDYKIGNVLTVDTSAIGDKDVHLRKVANTPSAMAEES
jgi:hypothetical protein